MSLNYSPSVGEILQCDFGNFPRLHDQSIDYANLTSDGRIPPEMVKNRLVVVLNGKINNCCIVVPLSSQQDLDKVSRKWHVSIASKLIAGNHHFQPVERWAKAEHIQQVSNTRLSKVKLGRDNQMLPRDVVTSIQEAVVRVIGGSSMLTPKPSLAAVQPVPIPNQVVSAEVM
jgi:uncharacterized protein YifN (PemK superfamily)